MIIVSNNQINELVEKLKAADDFTGIPLWSDQKPIECLYAAMGWAVDSKKPQTIMDIVRCLSILPLPTNRLFEFLAEEEKLVFLHLLVDAMFYENAEQEE